MEKGFEHSQPQTSSLARHLRLVVGLSPRGLRLVLG